MKLKAFSITPKEGQVLNWSLGLFVVFSVFNLIDGWTSVPNAGQGVLTNAFATVQSNDGAYILLSSCRCFTTVPFYSRGGN